MADKIGVYNLGEGGVNVDKNPLRTDDNEALETQNAHYDATRKRLGGLTKRPGLARFNGVGLGAPVLGGIQAPYPGVARATGAGGGGFPGDDGGTGEPSLGTGQAPGDSSNPAYPGSTPGSSSNTPTYASAGAGAFTTGALFGGARLIVIGRDDTTHGNTGGVGWYVSSKKLADVANLTTGPGPAEGPYNFPPTSLFPVAKGLPFAIYPTTGYVYYALAHEQVTPTGSPAVQTIRKTNGAIDVVACTTPTSDGAAPSAWLTSGSTGVCRASITTMHIGADGFIYLGQKLKAAGQNITGNAGRLLKLDPGNNAITVLNTSTGPVSGTANTYIAAIPYAIAHFQNSVYWGEFNLGATSELVQDVPAVISATTTDQAYSVADVSLTQGEGVVWMYPFPQVAPASDPTMDVFSNRVLFAGVATNKATPALAYVMMRKRGAVGDATKWSAVKQGDGGSTVNANYFVSAVAFNDKLYASFYNPTQTAKIYEFTPSYGAAHLDTDGFWNGDGVWAEVFASTSSGDRVPYQLYVDDGVMYAIGTLGLGAGRHHMYTTNGTAWVDVTSALPNSPNSTAPVPPILFGLNQ